MAVYVLNFQAPKDIDELWYLYRTYGTTNIDVLYEDGTQTRWTVPQRAVFGDIVVFACARTAKQHMAHVYVQTKETENMKLIAFAKSQKRKYDRFSGKIIAVGVVAGNPYPDGDFGARAFSARISIIHILDDPIDISEFDGAIKLNQFGAHTTLNDEQWALIRRRIEETLPD